ncbi:hypothetical protein KKC52_10335 [bacterium]|nr:hypothetical protein [bacterium]
MGGAFVSVADDLSCLYWNPAGLTRLKKGEILVSYDELANSNYLVIINPGKVKRLIKQELNDEEIGKETKSDILVKGSFTKSGDTFRIDAKAIDAHNLTLLVAESVEGDVNGLFDLVYDLAWQLDRKLYFKLNPGKEVATDLNNIGGLYLALKDYPKAEELFKKAEEELSKTGFKWKGNPGMVEVCLATGRYEQALKLLEEMTPGWFSSLPYQILYHQQRGLGLKGSGRLKEASGEFLRAVLMIEEMRERVKGEKIGFFGAGGRIRAYQELVATLSERAIKGEEQDERFGPYGRDLACAAFYFSESTKARLKTKARMTDF